MGISRTNIHKEIKKNHRFHRGDGDGIFHPREIRTQAVSRCEQGHLASENVFGDASRKIRWYADGPNMNFNGNWYQSFQIILTYDNGR